VKHLIIPFIFLCLIIGGGFLEGAALNSNFEQLSQRIEQVCQKIDAQQAVAPSDITDISDWWAGKKKVMHAYLPHTEIKEVDFWLAEAASYVKTGDYSHARAKLKTLLKMASSVPSSFSFTFENIF